jgi:hypothetical protein
MMLLVRDAAKEFHPVVGIGALSSPIVQIRERDEWIGWQPVSFIAEVSKNPTTKVARWLLGVVDKAIDELYIDDLREDELVSPKTLRTPTPDEIATLLKESVEQRKLHHRYARSSDYKIKLEGEDGQVAWDQRARTHLFRSKRALALAELLDARSVLARCFGRAPSKEGLVLLLDDPDGVRVVKKIVKRAKAERVGIAMADISVCGSIAPYSNILGGKLVSMLMTSPEVVAAYRRRYAEAVSEIASSMAGRPIVRPSHLVFLGTTSLYGGGSSQYNRIKIPCQRIGGAVEDVLEFQRLGMSEAFGTSHYSNETVDALVDLVQQSSGGQRVNSIFGEGVSPKLRKVRDGLGLLDFPAELLLRHGRQRIVYGVTLIRNTRDFLLGITSRPDYRFSVALGSAGTAAISGWWKERWLQPRIQSEEVLSHVAGHALVHPIRHGARVILPPDGIQGELPLGAFA